MDGRFFYKWGDRTDIVIKLKQHGKPFVVPDKFLNSGILQIQRYVERVVCIGRMLEPYTWFNLPKWYKDFPHTVGRIKKLERLASDPEGMYHGYSVFNRSVGEGPEPPILVGVIDQPRCQFNYRNGLAVFYFNSPIGGRPYKKGAKVPSIPESEAFYFEDTEISVGPRDFCRAKGETAVGSSKHCTPYEGI